MFPYEIAACLPPCSKHHRCRRARRGNPKKHTNRMHVHTHSTNRRLRITEHPFLRLTVSCSAINQFESLPWCPISSRNTCDLKRVRSDHPLGELSSGREVPPEPPENWLNINRRSREISSQLVDDCCLIRTTTRVDSVWTLVCKNTQRPIQRCVF